MKIGLDIHGVINKEPKLFAELSEALILNGHEVHVITGSRITDLIKKELALYGIRWTKLFLITDYHLEKGNKVSFDEIGNPWIDEDLWNRTKALYCSEEEIHFHIDDSEIYGQFFETPYCLFNFNRRRFQWFYQEESAGEFLLTTPELVKDIIVSLAEGFQISMNSKTVKA